MAYRADVQRPIRGSIFRSFAFFVASALAVAAAGQDPDETPDATAF